MLEEKKGKAKKSRGRVRSEKTRKSLLVAAQTLFAQKGMDLTTIDDITEKANVGKGTFYYHFTNKNEVVTQLMANTLQDLRANIDAKCQNVTDLTTLLDSLIGAHLEFFNRRWEDFVLFFQGRADLTLQEGYEGIESPFIEYLQHIAGLLDNAIEFHLSTNMLSRISCAVAGFVSGYYSFAVIALDEEQIEKTLRPVRDSLVAGLTRFIKEAIPNIEASKTK